MTESAPRRKRLTWPDAQQRFQALFKRGLNRPGEMENRFGELLASLMDT
jgi:hypothetical protein